MEWQIGDRIENHCEIHEIKMGGMGIVYLCYDLEWRGPVAIKTFRPEFLLNDEARERFTREALTWVNLEKHRNIVRPYFVKRIEGQPYIFLEFIAGGNLSDFMINNILDLQMGLNFAIQFCKGMEYANEKLGGIVHRDIKPANIMITQDKIVKITDFGLVKAAREKTREVLTSGKSDAARSMPAGSLPYMAPEQFSPGEIDTRADIYSFGIVLFQMFTDGKFPYPFTNSTTPVEFRDYHLKEKPFQPREYNSRLPRRLASCILKCLEKDPNNRPQNFTELKEKLHDIYHKITGEELIFREEPEELEAWELSLKGVALANLGRAADAIECHDRALRINPRDAKAWNNKGNALGNLGKPTEAIACFDKALETNPRDAVAWYNKGVGLYSLGKPADAIECYDRALEINPRYAKAWNNKGIPLDSLGRLAEALECYNRALEINPRLAEAWGNKGLALDKSGKPAEAIECYDRALKINPRDAEVWYSKGAALFGLRRFDKAKKCAEQALSINPNLVKAQQIRQFCPATQINRLISDELEVTKLYDQGTSLLTQQRFTEAIKCFDKALEINPRYGGAWFNKGNALGKLKMYTEAIDCYDKVLDIDLEDPEVLRNKGASLGCLQKFDEAIKCYDRALEINPRYVEAWNNKGNALCKLRKFSEAIECYDRVLEIYPRLAEAWCNKANVLADLERPAEAIECYDRGLEINPRQAEAWAGKGVVLGKSGRPSEAIECYDRALEINPQYAEVWYDKGAALVNLGKAAEGIECFDRALKINPRDAEVWYSKGAALANLERFEEAKTCAERALSINPQFRAARELKELCERGY